MKGAACGFELQRCLLWGWRRMHTTTGSDLRILKARQGRLGASFGRGALGLLVAITLSSAPSLAEAESSRRAQSSGLARPSGFLLELEMGTTSPTVAGSLGGLSGLGGVWVFRPGLVIGGQIRRFGLGLLLGTRIGRTVRSLEGEDEESTTLSLTLGPAFDFEIWGTNLAAIFVKASVPVYLGESSSGRDSAGFGIDAGIGGRVFFHRHFSIGIMIGVDTQFLWWEYDPEYSPNTSGSDIGVSLYGSVVMRFVGGGSRATRRRGRGRSGR